MYHVVKQWLKIGHQQRWIVICSGVPVRCVTLIKYILEGKRGAGSNVE